MPARAHRHRWCWEVFSFQILWCTPLRLWAT